MAVLKYATCPVHVINIGVKPCLRQLACNYVHSESNDMCRPNTQRHAAWRSGWLQFTAAVAIARTVKAASARWSSSLGSVSAAILPCGHSAGSLPAASKGMLRSGTAWRGMVTVNAQALRQLARAPPESSRQKCSTPRSGEQWDKYPNLKLCQLLSYDALHTLGALLQAPGVAHHVLTHSRVQGGAVQDEPLRSQCQPCSAANAAYVCTCVHGV